MPNEKPTPANLNLKITEDERWDFKELCTRHRMSQVEGFRRAVILLREHLEDGGRTAKSKDDTT